MKNMFFLEIKHKEEFRLSPLKNKTRKKKKSRSCDRSQAADRTSSSVLWRNIKPLTAERGWSAACLRRPLCRGPRLWCPSLWTHSKRHVKISFSDAPHVRKTYISCMWKSPNERSCCGKQRRRQVLEPTHLFLAPHAARNRHKHSEFLVCSWHTASELLRRSPFVCVSWQKTNLS